MKRKRKKSKSSKAKISKQDHSPLQQHSLLTQEDPHKHEMLRSARLKPDDLKDGQRLLMLQDGKFWPARLNSTKLPDVYGVVMDRCV